MLVNKYWKEDNSLKKSAKRKSVKDVTLPTESTINNIEVDIRKAKLESPNTTQRKSSQPNITLSDIHSITVNEHEQQL